MVLSARHSVLYNSKRSGVGTYKWRGIAINSCTVLCVEITSLFYSWIAGITAGRVCDEATDNVAALSGSTRRHYSHNDLWALQLAITPSFNMEKPTYNRRRLPLDEIKVLK